SKCVEQQIGNSFAIVTEHAGVGAVEKGRQMQAQIVAAALLEFSEEVRRPIRFALCVVDLVGIIEEGTETASLVLCNRILIQGGVEACEVGAKGGSGKMVEREALATGRGAFDHFAVRALKESVERPVAAVCR